MHVWRSLSLSAVAVLVVLGSGCAHEPRQVMVSGRVTFQGQPIDSGQIVFAAAAADVSSSFSTIENGKYRLKTTPGAKQIRITATKETGRMLPGGMDQMVPERVDFIPAEYNSATQLTRTVTVNGPNVFDFNLP